MRAGEAVARPGRDSALAVGGEVLRGEDVISEVRRVVIATPLALGLLWQPGQSVEIEVAPRTWRRYLLADVAPAAGRLELIVSLASGGPGAWWAAVADVGDAVTLRGLRDEHLLDRSARHHLVAGDETAISLFAALERWRPARAVVSGLIEVAPWASWHVGNRAPARLATTPRVVAEPGRRLGRALARRAGAGGTARYVIGSRTLVAQCRAALAGAGDGVRFLETWAT